MCQGLASTTRNELRDLRASLLTAVEVGDPPERIGELVGRVLRAMDEAEQ